MNSTRKYYDDLKTNFLTYNNSIKTIMFVGSSLGDGVSTTSIGFSESLAAGSMKGVVLIDANFRTPSLLSRFQIDPKTFGLAEILLDGRPPSPIKIENSNLYALPCEESRLGPQALFDSSRFSQFLDDMLDGRPPSPVKIENSNLCTLPYGESRSSQFSQFLDDMLDGRSPSPVKIENSNLYVLPCGESRLGPQALFDSSRFSQFLDDMKARFDYVVFDAPPALSATESLRIAAQVDAVILVVKSGVNRREIAKKVKEKIEAVGGNVMGVVLNRRKFYIPDKLYKLFFGN